MGPAGEKTFKGIVFSQGKTAGTGKRIPREDVARLCAEALRSSKSRVTFECWTTPLHHRRLPWHELSPDAVGGLADVKHDTAMLAGAATICGVSCLTSVVLAKGARRLLRLVRR